RGKNPPKLRGQSGTESPEWVLVTMAPVLIRKNTQTTMNLLYLWRAVAFTPLFLFQERGGHDRHGLGPARFVDRRGRGHLGHRVIGVAGHPGAGQVFGLGTPQGHDVD